MHDQVGVQMACQAAQTLGAGKSLAGLVPRNVSLGLCLCTWCCLLDIYGVLEARWQAPLQVLGNLQGKQPLNRLV